MGWAASWLGLGAVKHTPGHVRDQCSHAVVLKDMGKCLSDAILLSALPSTFTV